MEEGEEKKERADARVIIAPLVFLPQQRDGFARRAQQQPYTPVLIPATLLSDGRLHATTDSFPWVIREALEPCGASEPPIGSLEDFDRFRSTHPNPAAEWPAIIHYTEELIASVANTVREQVTIEAYDRAPTLIQAGYAPSSPAKRLIELTNYFCEHVQHVPGCLNALTADAPAKPLLADAERRRMSRRHVGQMGAAYPLAHLQREALHHLLAIENGQFLTVNGPPGTGKTTLIQSVVANYYVAAALEEQDAPVIFVVSANNNAVTNVLDSFAAAAPHAKEPDPLTRRWLPNLFSFGLFLPAASQKVDESKYHVARLPMYTRPLAGWPLTMLDSLQTAEAAFTETAMAYLREGATSIAKIKSRLLQRLRGLGERLDRVLDASEAVLAHRASFAPLTPDQASHAFSQREASANEEAANVRADLTTAMSKVIAAQTRLAEMESASDNALQAFSPPGLLNLLLGIFPQVRAQRWDKSRSMLKPAGFQDGVFSSLKPPSSDRLRSALGAKLAPLRVHVADLRSSAEVRRKEAEYRVNRQRSEVERRRAELGSWTSAESEWLEVIDDLVALLPPRESDIGVDRERLIRDPSCADACLDITVRHEMFLLATHYWEARWLQSSRELMTDSGALRGFQKGKTRQNAEKRLRHLAQLTPCFISTLFMLPEHFHYFNRAAAPGAQNAPLTNFVDLLIVDEAGQVPPEVGAPALALAEKALIIGDIHQIEPVWSVGTAVDYGTLNSTGLLQSEAELDEAGALAHNGSLMKLARRGSAFTRDDEQGLFLSEHRRCQTPIIQICNELVYKGRLVPCTPVVENPVLPALGWANVRSGSIQGARSRSNPGEAEAIAEWLSRRRAQIENGYGKKLEQVVGVLTPFGNQKPVLRKLLRQYRIGDELTVGTIHALQGADRDVIIFSPVHTKEDGNTPFFDNGPNLANVAVSRARHSFLVFGDMRMFNPARRSCSSGVLAAHLFRGGIEIRDVLSRPEFIRGANRDHTSRIETIEAHRATLRDALTHAVERVLIVSPYISEKAISEDNIPMIISSARGKHVRVVVVFDPELNRDGPSFRESARQGIALLKAAGAEVCNVVRVHSKTLAVDDKWIVEGSFNWLSAMRDSDSRYARQERSLRYEGPLAHEFCRAAWTEVMEAGTQSQKVSAGRSYGALPQTGEALETDD